MLVCIGCGGSPSSPSTKGQWGGDHASLTVGDATSHVEFDCAHGDFSGAITTASFSLAGSFVREHGGPIREDERLDARPAVYNGSIRESSMTLTVRLTDTNEILGPFTLTRGSTGRIVKCL
jgi:hypothetical protein